MGADLQAGACSGRYGVIIAHTIAWRQRMPPEGGTTQRPRPARLDAAGLMRLTCRRYCETASDWNVVGVTSLQPLTTDPSLNRQTSPGRHCGPWESTNARL